MSNCKCPKCGKSKYCEVYKTPNKKDKEIAELKASIKGLLLRWTGIEQNSRGKTHLNPALLFIEELEALSKEKERKKRRE